jgi:hypothetical protein
MFNQIRVCFVSFCTLRGNRTFRLILLLVFILLSASASGGFEQPDKSKYITIDEIQAGMKGYCLSCLKDTEVEKFDLEVISVVYNMNRGRDAILVKVDDERFIHAGVIAGCSGSPVYIDGRLAGAMAFGWSNSKDPIYGVTPIKDMLEAGKGGDSAEDFGARLSGVIFDYTRGLDFAEVEERFEGFLASRSQYSGGMPTLRCPVVISGLPGSAVERLGAELESFGLMAVAGPGGGTSKSGAARSSDVQLEPGSSLLVPLVTGDITMLAAGTATEVIGDTVYGFGHGLLTYGPVDLPMATGQIHTVVASRVRSFKVASMLDIVGALKVDEATAIRGQIGAEAYMFPMTVKVDRYNYTEQKVFNCRVAYNRLLTGSMIGAVINGAVLYGGDLPPDNMLEYKVSIGVEGAGTITFENVSTGQGISDVFIETVNSIRLLMNNPFREVGIESIDVEIRIKPENIASHIWSVQVLDSTVKAGEPLDIEVVLESVLSPKRRLRYSIVVPENLEPGEYNLIVCGGSEYLKFLSQAVPYRFAAKNFETLIEAMKEILAVERDRLYCILVLPAGGIVLERAELSDLPDTKALVLGDSKRALAAQPYRHWIEKSSKTGTIIEDKKSLKIKVEE